MAGYFEQWSAPSKKLNAPPEVEQLPSLHPEVDRPPARDDRCQPSAEVLDAAGIRTVAPYLAFLDGADGLADRAEHPEGHGP